ncbi:hypothetical protein DES53_102288 [Roseimicrobium gellanilyticum]|uniref:Uncharacterized protein n=1 Tax=Roseimicrobium gellanilyticum TaxID=748857 RepID=A0A366HSJ8_9BACT|nr:hypothetical protein [Roseimicrobium gellanilyticum]RBP45904.1 hypothetical protein DES53_102288 [Roseimicrobium gellanilyticum]
MQNPPRRSRKIGLTQGGRVKDGRTVEKSSRSRREDFAENYALTWARTLGQLD